MFRVGIVGHRHFTRREEREFTARHCREILRQARATHGEVSALSALAEGADTIFAQSALALNLHLDIVRPFIRYHEDFASQSARRRYFRLRDSARHETSLPYETRCEEAYEEAMGWVVDQSDLLVAVWDGRVGVTGRAVGRAVRRHRPWLHVDTLNLSVVSHAGGLTPVGSGDSISCQLLTTSESS